VEHELIKELLQWMHKNFVYQRRQSLKQLFDECLKFDDQNPDVFRKTLDSFFQLNENRFLIQDVAAATADNTPLLVKQLMTDASGNLKSKVQVDELFGSVLRYLESYPTNIGLDLLSAICRLIRDDFENSDGRNRMERYLYTLKQSKLFENGWGNLVSLLEIIPQTLREPLIECVITIYPEISYSIELYESFKSEVAFESCVDKINIRINSLLGA
jgi:ATP-dependent DNA helicase RecQ